MYRIGSNPNCPGDVQIPLHMHDIVDIPLQELYAEWIDEEISADTTTSVD